MEKSINTKEWDMSGPEFTSYSRASDIIDYANTYDETAKDYLYVRDDVASTLKLFVKDDSSHVAHEAAQLCDIADRLNNEDTTKRSRVLHALREYKYRFKSNEYIYLTNIMGDFPIINQYITDALDTFDDPKSDWQTDALPPNLKTLAELARAVNIESIRIKAAQALVNITGEQTNDEERRRLVGAIETTYAPLLELLGYDAFAATLLAQATRVRFVETGNEAYLKRAEEIFDSLGDRSSLERFTENYLEGFFSESGISTERIIDSTGGYPVYFDHALIQLSDDREARSVGRIKTIESLARKMLRQEHLDESPDRQPVDIVGFTIICPKTTDVCDTLTHTLRIAQSQPGFTLNPSPSRAQAFQIKTAVESPLKDAALQSLRALGIGEDDVDLSSDASDFEVVKLTYCVDHRLDDGKVVKIPIEIQLVDKISRKASRTGDDSHIAHKLRKYILSGEENSLYLDSNASRDDIKSFQERIHSRKVHTECNELTSNKRSHYRGESLRIEIDPYSVKNLGSRTLQLAEV